MIIKTEIPILKVNGIDINTYYLQVVNCEVLLSRDIRYLVLHYTGNSKDTALANANYFLTKDRNASAHYFVDETSIYQSVAISHKALHCGTTKTYYHSECRNSNSIGIEMCCSGDYKVSKTTQENTIHLVVELCKLLGVNANDVDKYVIRHYDVTHKSCPAQWSENEKEFVEFKNNVRKLLSSPPITSTSTVDIVEDNVFKIGDTVKVTPNAKYVYCNTFSKLLQDKCMYIKKLKGTTATLSLSKTGVAVCAINTKYLVKFEPYLVKVNTDSLNIRKDAGTNYTVIGKITDKGVYTVVNEKNGTGATKWLELKSGGFISADYVKKV